LTVHIKVELSVQLFNDFYITKRILNWWIQYHYM